MSEKKDTKKTIEDLKASVFKRMDSIKENEKQISSSNTFQTSDAEDYTPQKDKSYKQKITKIANRKMSETQSFWDLHLLCISFKNLT